jgi:hypothetical protein
MLKSGVVFGPWIGEFGWELFSWQAYCRAISRKYDKTVVIARPGNNFLYSDFCDDYLAFEPPPDGIVDSHMNTAVKNFDVVQFMRSSLPEEELNTHEWSWLQPTKIGNPPYDHWRASVRVPGFGDVVPEYKLYRGDSRKKVDIVIHARDRKIREIDNWSIDAWNNLVKMFPPGTSIACIGSKEESLHLDGTFDARGYCLEQTIGILSSARCILGPSSGPMHLATLSGCPQVVWTSNPKQNFSRYKYCWNPFYVNVDVISTPTPAPSDVYKIAEKYIDKSQIIEKHLRLG